MRGYARVILIVTLVCVLGALLVGAGTIDGNPSYAGEKDLIVSYNTHIGEKAEIDGQTVDTDPVRIEIEYGPETLELVVVNVNEPVETGESLRVFGTVTNDRTVEAETTVVREPWELWYVYGISLVGGFWVLARVANGWRVDRSDLAVIPRETTLTAARFGFSGDQEKGCDNEESTGTGGGGRDG